MTKPTASAVIRVLVTTTASAIRADPMAAELMALSADHLYRGTRLLTRSLAGQLGHAARAIGGHFDDGRSATR
jgi:hypothetical protein